MRQLVLARVSADVAKHFYNLQRSTEIEVSWALVSVQEHGKNAALVSVAS